MSNVDVKIDEKIKQKVTEPKKWKVIMLNDDHTPMDFVVAVLTEIFKHTKESAEKLMLTIHTDGSAVAGVYSFEIAEIKGIDTTNLARSNGYPLQIKLEEE